MTIKDILLYMWLVLTNQPSGTDIKQLIADIIDYESGLYE